MTDSPWLEDACSLVDAFRRGDRSPVEELETCLRAIEQSDLNAFTHLDPERALAAARSADVSLPFGGVPTGFKALMPVEGWPDDSCSVALAGRVSDYSATHVQRLFDAGVVPVGMTNASEFGGLNVSTNRLYGTTHNPWNHERTAGGSSGGSAAAVAGGLVPIATGGDGGGSIRIPAGFTGLVGMKGTAGRIPRGPRTEINPLTVVYGPMARSVRDVARWYDVSCGYDMHDPYSIPKREQWEDELGTFDLRGMRVAVVADLGVATVSPEVERAVVAGAEALIRDAGLVRVDLPVRVPGVGYEWAVSNLVQLRRELGDRWPDCKDDLTLEMAFGLYLADEQCSLELMANVENARIALNETMAEIFEQVDFVIAATNPDVAFGADVTLNQQVAGRPVGPENNGVLTIPSNIVGNPAVSIPVEPVEGLPVGMQIIGRHHADQLLLDLAAIVERERPWPLVAADAPH